MKKVIVLVSIFFIFASYVYAETEAEYIASTKKISSKRDTKDIYYKEFLKNPDKFFGVRVYVLAKIMEIQETENGSFIQAAISRNYDSIIVNYPGKMKIYTDDMIKIYGKCLGSFEGVNAFGVTMAWPVIDAKYIKLHKKSR